MRASQETAEIRGLIVAADFGMQRLAIFEALLLLFAGAGLKVEV